MKIKVEKGLIFYEGGTVMGCLFADLVAQANGLFWAENFVKKFDGQTLTLDLNLKIKGD